MRKGKALYASGIFLGLFFVSIVTASHGVLLTEVIAHYGLRSGQKGYMTSANNLGCVLACVSAMFVMGRLPKAALFPIGLSLSSLLLFAMGFAPPFWALIALMLLMGVSLGYVDFLASSVTADLFEGRQKTLMMCTLHAVFGIGGILTPSIFRGMLEAGVAWNRVYTTVAACGLVALLYFLPLALKRLRARDFPEGETRRLTARELRAFVCDRRRALMLAATALYSFGLGTVSVWTCRFFELRFDNPQLGATALSLYWFALMISRLATGLFAFPALKLIRVSGFATAILLGVGSLSGNPLVMCVALPLSALAGGSTIPLLLNLFAEEARGNTFLSTTCAFFFIYGAQVFCPTALGVIESTVGVAGCMTAAAVLALAQGLIMLRVRE